jgi:hypothetical protein
MSAVGGAVSAGLTPGVFSNLGTTGSVIARAAVGNVLTQGIAVAVGMQRRFDWRGVAASAVGAGVGQAVGLVFGEAFGSTPAGQFGAGLATGLVARTAAAVMHGGKVAIQQVAIDAFGNALGSSLASAASEPNAPPAASPQENAALREMFELDSRAGHPFDANTRIANGIAPAGTHVKATLDQIVRAMSDGDLPRDDEGVQLAAGRGFGGLGSGPEASPELKRGLRAEWGRGAATARLGNSSSADALGFVATTAVSGYVPEGVSATDLAGRFVQGLWSAVKGLTVEPLLQVRDLSLAGASVAYNELLRGDRETLWLPEMKSGLAEAYGTGASQSRLLLQSNPFTGIGVASYDLTTAAMNRDWGGVAEGAGGLAGGLAIGKGVSNFGSYGVRWTPGDLGPMSMSFQRGATTLFNFELVTPRNGPGVVSFGDDLLHAAGNWLKADTPAPIPLQVGLALKGQTFNTFGELRSAVWRAVAADEDLSGAFRQKSFGEMQAGRAPFAPPAFQNSQFGLKFNLHHVESIATGGNVYDLSNLRIVSPLTHSLLHGRFK